ncbi:AB-hydrolase YheT [Martensiomyces pterosporus]|nr:AB-hydrolase YheT [Martensiomyces pterosporus]
MGGSRSKGRYNVRLVHAKRTQPTKSPSPTATLADVIQEECPSLAEGATFRPSPLVPGPHAQTIYAFLGYYAYYAHSQIFPKFTRELFALSDGGTVALDWALCDNYSERPIVTVLSGVTGTSCDFYVRKCYEKFVELQYSVVVIHSRGCGGSALTTPLPFHCGFTQDYREVVRGIHQRMPSCRLLGLSFSLGANVMAKYIGEEGANCPLTAGVVVGNPYDMFKVIEHLDSRFFSPNKIYDTAILNFLKGAFKENQRAITSAPVKFDVRRISRSSTIMEFTEEMTRKAFGYASAKDLLDDSSSSPHMDSISIPVLFLNSLDDPICIERLIPYEKFLSNPHLVLGLTEHGGHIGYMGGSWPSSWIEHPVSQFFQCMLKHYG